jgi:hypothetical protein
MWCCMTLEATAAEIVKKTPTIVPIKYDIVNASPSKWRWMPHYLWGLWTGQHGSRNTFWTKCYFSLPYRVQRMVYGVWRPYHRTHHYLSLCTPGVCPWCGSNDVWKSSWNTSYQGPGMICGSCQRTFELSNKCGVQDCEMDHQKAGY